MGRNLFRKISLLNRISLRRFMVILDCLTFILFYQEKEITWGNRWDRYLLNTDAQIHWYSIVNSLIIALFLTAMVAIIMLRTLNRDIALYNEEDLKVCVTKC